MWRFVVLIAAPVIGAFVKAPPGHCLRPTFGDLAAHLSGFSNSKDFYAKDEFHEALQFCQISRLLPEKDVFLKFIDALAKETQQNANFVTSKTPLGGAGRLQLACGGFSTGGEDSFEVAQDFFAVADGVGGAGAFSASLARALAEGARDGFLQATEGGAVKSPRELAKHVFRHASREARKAESAHNAGLGEDVIPAPGASTLVFGLLQPNSENLIVSNLGDSGAAVYRRSPSHGFRRHPVFITESQQLSWNTPQQIKGDEPMGAKYADVHSVPLQEGDVIIAASDGVLDNLYLDEMAELLTLPVTPSESKLYGTELTTAKSEVLPFWSQHPDPNLAFVTPPGLMARLIALAARYVSVNASRPCPFGLGALASLRGHPSRNRSKPDDVTATVCYAISDKELKEPSSKRQDAVPKSDPSSIRPHP